MADVFSIQGRESDPRLPMSDVSRSDAEMGGTGERAARPEATAIPSPVDPDLHPMILRFARPNEASSSVLISALFPSRNPDDAIHLERVPITERLLDATQCLVQMIQQLRSPASGWDPNLPQTPENLLPYITEEAFGVLASTKPAVDETSPDAEAGEIPLPPLVTPTPPLPTADAPCLLNHLLPWLLWGVARSSYEVIRLVEGLPALVQTEDGDWQSGMLRLVIGLHIATPEQPCAIDLATHQAPPATLEPTTLIWSESCALCREPTAIADVLAQLIQHSQWTTPALKPFLDGIPAEALVPQQPWRSGTVQLQLGFEFIALAENNQPDADPTSTTTPVPDSTAMPLSALPAASENPWDDPTLQFTEAAWLKNYTTAVLRQQMHDTVAYLPSLQTFLQTGMNTSSDASGESAAALSPEKIALPVVQDACWLADILDNSLTLSNRDVLQRAIALSDLRQWILWCLSRSAYEIMQLIGGISVNVLQPGQSWQMGTFRLLASLHLRTLERDWYLDIGTEQPLSPKGTTVANDSIIYSDDNDWCHHPISLDALHSRMLEYIDQTTPELQLLLRGTGVDLLIEDHSLEGAIQLSLEFEFLPAIA